MSSNQSLCSSLVIMVLGKSSRIVEYAIWQPGGTGFRRRSHVPKSLGACLPRDMYVITEVIKGNLEYNKPYSSVLVLPPMTEQRIALKEHFHIYPIFLHTLPYAVHGRWRSTRPTSQALVRNCNGIGLIGGGAFRRPKYYLAIDMIPAFT